MRGSAEVAVIVSVRAVLRRTYPLLILVVGVTSARASVPPLRPPAWLSTDGRKLWATLIDGDPQWSNWRDLMSQDPAKSQLASELHHIMKDIDVQLGADSPRLYVAATDIIYRRLVSDPRYRELDVDISNPAREVRESFAQLASRRAGAGTTPPEAAYRRAEREVRERHRLSESAYLPFELTREISKWAWRYANHSAIDRAAVSKAEFDDWRIKLKAAVEERYARDITSIYRAIVLDQDERVRSRLMIVRIDNPDYVEHPLPEFFPKNYTAEFIDGKDLSVDERTRAHLVYRVFDRLEINEVLAYVRDARHGLVAIFIRESSLDLTRDPDAIYDLPRMGLLWLYHFAWTQADSRRDYITKLLNVEYQGLNTDRAIEAEIVRLDQRTEEYGAADATDWPRRLFTSLENSIWVYNLFDEVYHARKRLYAWQVMTRGFEFWQNLAEVAGRSDLPRIEVDPPSGEDLAFIGESEWDDDQPEIPGKARWQLRRLRLDPSEKSGGTHAIDDPNERRPVFITKGRNLRGIPRWRLPSRERLASMEPVADPTGRPTKWIAARPELMLEPTFTGRRFVVPIPTPEGYRPIPNEHGTVVGTPDRGHYALDLGERLPPPIGNLKLSFAVDPAFPRTSLRLNLSSRHLRPAIEMLERQGATALARAINKAGDLSAAALARVIARESVYTCAPRRRAQVGLADFVGSDGRARLQCHVAAESLRDILELALRTHPWRDRVAVRIVTTLSSRIINGNTGSLNLPAHAEVDVIIDGAISETLDSTPQTLESRLMETAKPMTEHHAASGDATWLSLDHGRDQFKAAVRDLREASSSLTQFPTDESIPTFRVLRAANLLLEEPMPSPKKFNSRVGELLEKNLGRRSVRDSKRILVRQMRRWGEQIDRAASYRDGLDPAIRDRGYRSGAAILLSPATLRALHRVVEHASKFEDSECESDLRSARRQD